MGDNDSIFSSSFFSKPFCPLHNILLPFSFLFFFFSFWISVLIFRWIATGNMRLLSAIHIILYTEHNKQLHNNIYQREWMKMGGRKKIFIVISFSVFIHDAIHKSRKKSYFFLSTKKLKICRQQNMCKYNCLNSTRALYFGYIYMFLTYIFLNHLHFCYSRVFFIIFLAKNSLSMNISREKVDFRDKKSSGGTWWKITSYFVIPSSINHHFCYCSFHIKTILFQRYLYNSGK